MGRIKRVLQDRWMTLVASFFVMSCAGALYSFGLYSQKLKTALHYDQETVSTIGFFKDLGANIGILAGILYDLTGSWLVLLLAAVFNMFGYMMAWAAVTGKISRPQVWHMCAYLWVGASSGAFASTAIIVTCVKNFPRNRGIVIGLLKGFVGLSGAMLTQIYRALYGQDPSSFMLIVAWFPSFVFLAFMFVIRPLPDRATDLRRELRNFYVFLAMAVVLAIFLMTVIVVQHLVEVPRSVNQALMGVMIVILALPVLVVVESEWKRKQADDHANSDTEKAENEVVGNDDLAGAENVDPEKVAAASHREDNDQARPRFRFSIKWLAAYVSYELRHMPERGKDHSVLQALASLDLWIVFVATTAGLGSGLMAIDNMGQLGSSLGYSQTNVSTFVSLLSIWNFFGRVGFGFISEACLQKRGIPRPAFLALVLAILAFGHLYIALAWPGALYLGSILIGMCFGAQMPVMFAIISEIFGLKYFGTLYNVGILASPLGTYILSVKVAGHLYDEEARKQRKGSSASGELLCNGSSCYRNTLFIMAGACSFGCAISVFLAFRTRRYYRSIQRKPAADDDY